MTVELPESRDSVGASRARHSKMVSIDELDIDIHDVKC